MARKTKENALETRSQLLDAAEKVFFEKGFSQTSLMDVAEAANMTRGAIYWHFKNKGDLFEAMADRVRLPLESLSEACADPNELDPLGKLRDFSIQVLKESVRNPRRRRVLTILFHKCELNDDTKQLELRRQASCVEYLQHMEKCLQKAIEQQQLPADLDTHQAAIAKMAFLMGLIGHWLFLPSSFDLEGSAETMVDGYFSMLHHSQHFRKKEHPSTQSPENH